MLVAHAIVKDTNNLCSISHIVVAAITCHLGMVEFSRVAITIAERGHSFALKETKSEISLKNTIRIVENSKTMHLSSFEFTLIVKFVVGTPSEFTLTMILTVFKLTLVSVIISPVYFAVSMENVCNKFTLVD